MNDSLKVYIYERAVDLFDRANRNSVDIKQEILIFLPKQKIATPEGKATLELMSLLAQKKALTGCPVTLEDAKKESANEMPGINILIGVSKSSNIQALKEVLDS